MLDLYPIPDVELPDMEIADSPMQDVWADSIFETIKNYVQKYEESLDAEHEVGIRLTSFGQSILMQVTNITYEKSVLMVFTGYVNGKKSTLIQHVNQLNFLLTSVDKEPTQEKRKIGFGSRD